jgi:hypothetical protein
MPSYDLNQVNILGNNFNQVNILGNDLNQVNKQLSRILIYINIK